MLLHNECQGIYRELKTGKLNEIVIPWACLKSDSTPCVVYRCIETGDLLIMPVKTFFDGRMSPLVV